MKKLLVTLLLFVTSIAYSQSGVGYLNYTVYNIISNGAGQYANNSANFVNMFDVTKGASVYTSGVTTAAKALYFVNSWQSSGVPNGGAYTGIKITGWFVPKETGTYSFAIDGDDGVDFSLDGVVVTSFYGPHGFSGYRFGTINLIAGKTYAFMARYQNWGGGWGLDLAWKRPSQSNWNIQSDECYSIAPATPTKKGIANFNFNTTITPSTFSVGSALNSVGSVDITTLLDSVKVNNLYKQQSITLSTTNNLTTLYNSIVTVSDVYMAFQEYANQGLFGNQSGISFTKGIQYQNADINNDNVFNESDCFALLQHLTGAKSLVDTFKLSKTLRIISQSRYDSIGKSNWNTFINPLSDSYTFDINTGKSIDTLNLALTWKGDVNLSHSTTPASNNLTSMALRSMSISNEINASILTELVNGKVYAYITLDPLQQQVVGTQFQLNYDNSILKFENVTFKTKGNPTNYGTNKGTYINLGSLVSDGSTILDNTTQYIITFTPTTPLNNVLGLISVGITDAVNKAGTQLKIKIN